MINTITKTASCFGMPVAGHVVEVHTPALLPISGTGTVAPWSMVAMGADVQGTGLSKLRTVTFRAANSNHPGTSAWSPPL